MKTKLLQVTLASLLIAGSASAQFYHRFYGTVSDDFLESGIALRLNAPQGYAMTGVSGSSSGIQSVMVTRTDISGTILGAPSFNNVYPIFNAAGQQLYAAGRRIIEVPTTSTNGQFAIWGDNSVGTSTVMTNFLYMLLNANGTVAAGMPRTYALPTQPLFVEATSMTPSISNPANVFVCGNVFFQGGTIVPMVMCLQAATGNIVWAWTYRTGSTVLKWTANDIIESPYPAVAPYVVIAGRFDASTTGQGDGCVFTLSAVNGAPFAPMQLYGTTTADEGLNAIELANNPFGSGPGFAVAGFVQDVAMPGFVRNSWAMKLSPAGVVDWSSILPHVDPTADDAAEDIIERLNTLGQYEYYVGGVCSPGFFGSSDELVFKLGANGIIVPNGHFTYGGPGRERAIQLDQYDNAATNGLSIFGNSTQSFSASNEFHLIKTYFNGYTACAMFVQPQSTPAGPGLLTSRKFDTFQQLFAQTQIAQMTAVGNTLICSAPTVAGGSNVRLAQQEETADASSPGVKLFPNPLSAEQGAVTITFDEPVKAGDAEVQLWNMLGQRCMHQTLPLAEGAAQLNVSLGEQLAPGIYHLTIRYNDKTSDIQVSVQ